jgi:hypothetical protein
MLVWWQQWVKHRQQRQELLESSCCHMEAYTMHRCVQRAQCHWPWQHGDAKSNYCQEDCLHVWVYIDGGLLVCNRYRCIAAWQGRVLRRQQLEELLQQGLVMSERLAAKAAFRGWREVSQ